MPLGGHSIILAKKIYLLWSRVERDLVQAYGYPFEEIAGQLELARDNPDAVPIAADAYWVEHLVGELPPSINPRTIPDQQAFFAVNEIAENLEAALCRA